MTIVRLHRTFFKIINEVNALVKENIVLEMKNIHKGFPGVKALQGVDFSLCEGEMHALNELHNKLDELLGW